MLLRVLRWTTERLDDQLRILDLGPSEPLGGPLRSSATSDVTQQQP